MHDDRKTLKDMFDRAGIEYTDTPPDPGGSWVFESQLGTTATILIADKSGNTYSDLAFHFDISGVLLGIRCME